MATTASSVIFKKCHWAREASFRKLSTQAKDFSSKNRVVLNIYRQLMRWCQSAPAVPLSTLVPPVHLESPENVDALRLKLVAQADSSGGVADATVHRLQSLLPPRIELQETQFTVPVHTISDLKQLFRFLFRLNSVDTTPEQQKSRISAAFTALRSLNELTSTLQGFESEREKHSDRSNVEFRIGQVVQHQEERWRGVIVGWSRPEASEPAERSSLTNRDYSEEAKDIIAYNVIWLETDSVIMGAPFGLSRVPQGELQLVRDESLLRIISPFLDQYFMGYDTHARTYLPNELQSYQYPVDSGDVPPRTLTAENAQLCQEIVSGVQDLASRLERYILDETSNPSERGLRLLADVQRGLSSLAAGKVLSSKERLASTEASVINLAARHLRELSNLQREVDDANFQRRLSKENKSRIRFSIGDVVIHKVYGFRGVVVGFDPTPKADVRNWDGLQHVANPMDHPFYEIIPDQSDCIEAFGGERPHRYVCQENLEACPDHRRWIDVDLEPEWQKSSQNGSYLPPVDVRYRYGDDLGDNGITERCISQIQNECHRWHVQARQAEPGDTTFAKLSLANLNTFLKLVDHWNDGRFVQATLEEMRKAHPEEDVRWQFETASLALKSERPDKALEIYKKLLDLDPEYAEAWNKVATCEFLLGNYNESQVAAEKALELDPEHCGALNGLGLIYFNRGEYNEAALCFRRSVSIDPWSRISTKLSVTLDILNSAVLRDDAED